MAFSRFPEEVWLQAEEVLRKVHIQQSITRASDAQEHNAEVLPIAQALVLLREDLRQMASAINGLMECELYCACGGNDVAVQWGEDKHSVDCPIVKADIALRGKNSQSG